MTHVERSIEVAVPVRAAYDQWTRFEEFPRSAVVQTGDGVRSPNRACCAPCRLMSTKAQTSDAHQPGPRNSGADLLSHGREPH